MDYATLLSSLSSLDQVAPPLAATTEIRAGADADLAHQVKDAPRLAPRLATKFGSSTRQLRSDAPLAEDQMRAVAPSIFADGKHVSRSERYVHIPTIEVLRGLRQSGFEPFMVAQGQSRIEGKTAYTRHMVRMRHAGSASVLQSRHRGGETVPEIILINSHDGASSYQMLAGMFRLCPVGHRRNYVQRRTMSRRSAHS